MKLSATEAELSAAMEMNAECTQVAEEKFALELKELRERSSGQAEKIKSLEEQLATATAQEETSKMQQELDM